MKGFKTVQRAAGERLAGGTPSAPRASFAAVVAGTAVGVAVYRMLRSG